VLVVQLRCFGGGDPHRAAGRHPACCSAMAAERPPPNARVAPLSGGRARWASHRGGKIPCLAAGESDFSPDAVWEVFRACCPRDFCVIRSQVYKHRAVFSGMSRRIKKRGVVGIAQPGLAGSACLLSSLEELLWS